MSPPACPKGAGIPSLRGQPDCDPPFPLPVSDVSAAPAAPKAARPADPRRPTDRPLPSRRFAQGAGLVPRGASGRDQPLGRGQGNLIQLEPDHLRLVGQTGEKSASSGRDGPPAPSTKALECVKQLRASRSLHKTSRETRTLKTRPLAFGRVRCRKPRRNPQGCPWIPPAPHPGRSRASVRSARRTRKGPESNPRAPRNRCRRMPSLAGVYIRHFLPSALLMSLFVLQDRLHGLLDLDRGARKGERRPVFGGVPLQHRRAVNLIAAATSLPTGLPQWQSRRRGQAFALPTVTNRSVLRAPQRNARMIGADLGLHLETFVARLV